jgi:glycosyltransferase involved in cell wall biosynthesis
MKITLVTDTWTPSINGVVTTLTNTVKVLETWGHQVQVIEPGQFRCVSAPGYPEVKLCWDLWRVGPMIEQFRPDAIHIATEGPLGLAARWYCKVDKRSIPHNTSYHTKFPEYINQITKIPADWIYWWMRLFHKFSTRVLVTNSEMKSELEQRGFKNLAVWNRGVDQDLFNSSRRRYLNQPYPVILCVSRASEEKGLDEFCSIRLDKGTLMLAGDGPILDRLKADYPDVVFLGYKKGSELAELYASADVFVFPSRTDTYGVVMLEALSSGTPVVAHDVTGPRGLIENGHNGYLTDNLAEGIQNALHLNRYAVEVSVIDYTWENCTQTFLDALTPIRPSDLV